MVASNFRSAAQTQTARLKDGTVLALRPLDGFNLSVDLTLKNLTDAANGKKPRHALPVEPGEMLLFSRRGSSIGIHSKKKDGVSRRIGDVLFASEATGNRLASGGMADVCATAKPPKAPRRKREPAHTPT